MITAQPRATPAITKAPRSFFFWLSSWHFRADYELGNYLLTLYMRNPRARIVSWLPVGDSVDGWNQEMPRLEPGPGSSLSEPWGPSCSSRSSLLHPPLAPASFGMNSHPPEILLFSQSFGLKYGSPAADVSWRGKRKVMAQGTEMLYETVDDSSVFKSRGNKGTISPWQRQLT